MSNMVRKQIYISPRQDTLLKRLAQLRGVSEAEIIRRAIDQEAAQPQPFTETQDETAWHEILQLVEGRKKLGITGVPYRWNRSEIYSERESRWIHDGDEAQDWALASILIDTNLLVYLVDQNDPLKQAKAREILGWLELNRTGCLSAQCLAEFVTVAMRKLRPPLSPGEALEWASRFARLWPVFDLTAQVLLEAVRGVRAYSLPYYDAQIWAAARMNQVPVVFSEDFQNGLFLEGVRFVNPLIGNRYQETGIGE
jgi:predicted nucleic acid-binding protein